MLQRKEEEEEEVWPVAAVVVVAAAAVPPAAELKRQRKNALSDRSAMMARAPKEGGFHSEGVDPAAPKALGEPGCREAPPPLGPSRDGASSVSDAADADGDGAIVLMMVAQGGRRMRRAETRGARRPPRPRRCARGARRRASDGARARRERERATQGPGRVVAVVVLFVSGSVRSMAGR